MVVDSSWREMAFAHRSDLQDGARLCCGPLANYLKISLPARIALCMCVDSSALSVSTIGTRIQLIGWLFRMLESKTRNLKGMLPERYGFPHEKNLKRLTV